MIDKYTKNFLQLHQMINPWDDEDNNYYNDLETDRINAEDNKRIEQEKSLLHKLRMKRNSLVLAESTDVSFTSDDLEKCIKIVEKF